MIAMGTLLHRIAPPTWMVDAVPTLKAGDHFIPGEQIERWIERGYQRVPQVALPGEIALRGDICDVFPMGSPRPMRIELFGNTIESIRWFDPENQRSAEPAHYIAQIPAKEFPTDEAGIRTFRHGWRSNFEGQPAQCPIYQSVSDRQFPAGLEYYIPLFFESMGTFFDYLSSNKLS